MPESDAHPALSAAIEEVSGVVMADATERGYPLTYVSPGFEQLTGYRSEDVVGTSCRLLQGAQTDPRSIAVLTDALAAGREAYVTLLNYRADGTPFWNEVSIAPQRDDRGQIVRYLGVQKDVTSRRQAEARIHELAYFDPLTGLANRARLHDELHAAVRRAQQTDGELALLFIDLDDFKGVNDGFGHHGGDALLRQVAGRLRSVVRPGDVLARPGGDEFTVLVKDVSEGAAALGTRVAARVVGALREPIVIDGRPVDVRASVGVSVFPRDAGAADELLRHADSAMYLAKHAGKDSFHVYSSSVSDRASAIAARPAFAPEDHLGELDRILRGGLIAAVYQPIVDLADGAAVGYEALARGPQGSPLERPDRLFAVAQVAGRVVELDWACRAAAVEGALGAGLGHTTSLFVNCEPEAVDAPCPERYAPTWARALRELELIVEITERAVTSRPAQLIAAVQGHVRSGRGIALDDLGADVRSLALLPLVEPDVMKLDLRLVQRRPSTEQAAIISAVNAESERTGASILAEGIETEEHLAVARSLGATLGQGWLWGRPGPLPAGAAKPRVRRIRRAIAVDGSTPFTVVAARRDTAVATKQLLLAMSHHLENRTIRIGEGAVILSAFQEARHFTPDTVRRYEMLAHSASLVAAFGIGLQDEPVSGVRGAGLPAGDPLAGEWSVLVLGPDFAGALVAVDLGDDGPDRERRFRFATTYDRGLVVDAARTLLSRIAPLPAGAVDL